MQRWAFTYQAQVLISAIPYPVSSKYSRLFRRDSRTPYRRFTSSVYRSIPYWLHYYNSIAVHKKKERERTSFQERRVENGPLGLASAQYRHAQRITIEAVRCIVWDRRRDQEKMCGPYQNSLQGRAISQKSQIRWSLRVLLQECGRSG